MKHFILAILILTSQSIFSQTNYKHLELVKAASPSENCVVIPSFFSRNTLSGSESVKNLQSEKIIRIELFYTRFQENPKFDQVQLNEDRMNRLTRLLPRIKKDRPEIIWMEQTGAATREEAVSYFHGFRIYTEDGPVLWPSKERESTPTSMFDVDNSIEKTFSHPSGTQIRIPANAVVFEDGKPVTGTYTFSYREYRNYADIVYSKAPSTIPNKAGYYSFTNSAGMYEIRGTKDGKNLLFQKEVIVDFNIIEK